MDIEQDVDTLTTPQALEVKGNIQSTVIVPESLAVCYNYEITLTNGVITQTRLVQRESNMWHYVEEQMVIITGELTDRNQEVANAIKNLHPNYEFKVKWFTCEPEPTAPEGESGEETSSPSEEDTPPLEE